MNNPFTPFTPGIFVNSDAWNFWIFEHLEEMDRDGLAAAVRRDVDFYTRRGGVAAVFYNLNFQRSFYPTRVGTPYWKDLSLDADGQLLLRGRPLSGGRGDDDAFRRMFLASRHVNELLPDFPALRYARCHENGAEMWHSMRMDDVHHTCAGEEWLPQHGDLWLDRKDLLRAWYRHDWSGEWRDRALDYGKREVFDYHLAMMREYVLGYESDGIELDWLRCLPVFAPGGDDAGTALLTDFMRATRAACEEAAAKWGHPLRVAARVPASLHEAYGVGLDVGAWAREGLVDVVIPSCRDISTEQDCDVRLYRALCPKPIILAPDLDFNIVSDNGWRYWMEFDAETDCGFASGWYHDGADTVYLYNHFPRMAVDPAEHPGFPESLAYLGDREAVAHRPRRHIFTRHAPVGEGLFPLSPYPPELGARSGNGSLMVNCGEGTAGRAARVIVCTAVPADLDVRVNTVPCGRMPADEPLPTRMPVSPGDRSRPPHSLQAAIPPGVLHDGWNSVELFNAGDADLSARDFVWLEVAVS